MGNSGGGWKYKTQTDYTKIYGQGIVRVGKKSVQVVLEADEKNPERTFVIPLDKAPENVRPGHWSMALSGDGSRLFSIAPIKGVFNCKFVQFATAQGQVPTPKLQTYVWEGKTNKYYSFTAILEIVEPAEYEGMRITNFMHYNFGEEDGQAVFTSRKSKYTQPMIDFMEELGAFQRGPLKFSENLLPAFEKRIKDANRTVQVIIKNGRIDSVMAVEDVKPKSRPAVPDDDFEDDDEPAPVKKTAKASPSAPWNEEEDTPTPAKSRAKADPYDDEEFEE